MAKQASMDMLHGPLLGKLLLLAVPIVLSSMLQQLFNTADIAVAGKFISSDAMAAVGSNAPVIASATRSPERRVGRMEVWATV